MRVTTAVLGSFLLTANPAQAADNTAKIVDQCRVAVRISILGANSGAGFGEFGDANYCIGYLNGYWAGYGVAAVRTGGVGRFCWPTVPTTGHQLAAVFVQWAERNPALWHLDPLATVELALSEAFPCRR